MKYPKRVNIYEFWDFVSKARESLTQFLFLCDKCALPVYIKFKKCVGYVLSHCITSSMPMVLAVQVGSTSLILHVTILWIWLPEDHCNIV